MVSPLSTTRRASCVRTTDFELHRFLRGKIVDRKKYDEWKDHNKIIEGELVQIHDSDSFHVGEYHESNSTEDDKRLIAAT